MIVDKPPAPWKAIAIVSTGNFLEMFDFMVFGFYAAAIAGVFFPRGNEYAALMLSLATFGAGFLMRPIGGLVLGPFLDRYGRRTGLLVTLGLMALGTITIAVTPGYVGIGLAAPVLVLIGRLIQGLSAGVEVGGVSVYLSEIAPANRKGFFVAWQSGSQQLAVVFAASIGMVLTSWLSPAEMKEWGWRIPFLIGCALVPFLFLVRRKLVETPAFAAQRRHPTIKEIYRSLYQAWGTIVLGTMLATMSTVSFYLITNYTPTFGTAVLNLSPMSALAVTLCVGISNFILLPVMGAVSDRIGRLPLMIGASFTAAATSYPALKFLVDAPSFERLLAVELWLAVVYACYNGAMIVYLTEIMPRSVRTSGFSLAYSLATAVFGGFTPAICTFLIHETGNRAMPGAWLSMAAVIGLCAATLLARTGSAQRIVSASAEPPHQGPDSSFAPLR